MHTFTATEEFVSDEKIVKTGYSVIRDEDGEYVGKVLNRYTKELCKEEDYFPFSSMTDFARTLRSAASAIQHGRRSSAKKKLADIACMLKLILRTPPGLELQEDPVIVVEGGCIQDVFVPVSDGNGPVTSLSYSLIDYDTFKDGEPTDEFMVDKWNSFSPKLQAYYREHCADEFAQYFRRPLDESRERE